MILVVDFGSQTAHLITRRLKDLGVESELVDPDDVYKVCTKRKPSGLIFSGGPASVYEKGAPSIERKIFSLGIPILGICYGFQLTSLLLGGKVVSGKKEYGPSELQMSNVKHSISNKLPKQFTVWMSHGDEITKLPEGFEILGATEHVPYAFVINTKKKILGLLFHPEVEHTEFGTDILEKFVEMCGIKKGEHTINIPEIEKKIKDTVGGAYVIGAVSGGIDSTVAGVLTAKAIGKRFIPVYVENGLMREETSQSVERIFSKHHVKPIIVDAAEETLRKLKGVVDPEEKRKVIGKLFIDVFEREMKKMVKKGLPVKFLLQGTVYSDFIESKGTKHAAKIKSHHNVGALPKNIKLKLLEPLRNFYKDEVRQIGKTLGLPNEFVWKQKFPGPGYAIRIRGEVTKDRLEKERQADTIVLEEIEKAGYMSKVFHSFPVLTGAESTAVKGDGRFFGEVVALRVTISSDEMTCGWAHLPYFVLQKISSRIVNEVPNVSRVVYDITSKPPATMEWE